LNEKYMPANVISRLNASHYKWGGPADSDCDGWHLARTPELSIIEEAMPAGTQETRHHHRRARQFFYVIEGELTLEIEQEFVTLHVGDGVEIAPGQAHQALNQSAAIARFLVTSQPPSHGDRVEG
jgi:mannose-6-phosphate isomerase-like protein (cupin superfamily)